MKLVIELDNKDLQKAVEGQVGKAISELTEKVIIEKNRLYCNQKD